MSEEPMTPTNEREPMTPTNEQDTPPPGNQQARRPAMTGAADLWRSATNGALAAAALILGGLLSAAVWLEDRPRALAGWVAERRAAWRTPRHAPPAVHALDTAALLTGAGLQERDTLPRLAVAPPAVSAPNVPDAAPVSHPANLDASSPPVQTATLTSPRPLWWQRGGRRSTRRRVIQAAVSLVVLAAIGLVIAHTALAALDDYHSLVSLESNGMAALRRVPEDVGLGTKSAPASAVTPDQIARARADAQTALNDFTRLQARLDHPDVFLSTATHVAHYAALLRSADLLTPIAVDAAHVAQQMIDGLVAVANTLASSSLIGNGGTNADPGLSIADLNQIVTGYTLSVPYIQDMLARLNAAPPSVLFAALNAKQLAEIQPALKLLPDIPAFLPVINSFIPVAPQILGIGQPANYLLMTLDSSEMRSTGGFQGNDAVFSVRGGRIGTLSLQDVYLLDSPYNSHYPGDTAQPPAAYQTWWPQPFLPWGLRDANLSPDFPTSAALDLQQLQSEGGDNVPIVNSSGVVTGKTPANVTGVIAIEPAVIQQLLDLTGPVTIGAPYNVTINSTNLEAEIHYFQLTNAGRQNGTKPGSGQGLSDPNKRFTALLGHALTERLKTLPKSTLLQFAQTAVNDLHTKDIQVAFTDPAAEQFLRNYQVSSELYSGPDDSLGVFDANLSGNKASQFLHTTLVDNVQLDATGGATHTLTIKYDWQPPLIQDGTDQNAVYSVLYNADHYDFNGLFYLQYVRVYTPPQAGLLSSSGWEYGQIEQTQSDVPGRGMFGAHYLLTGDANAHPVTWTVPTPAVSWYVPMAYTPGQPYQLHVQRQAGADEAAVVTVTQPCAGQPAATFSNALTTNWVLAAPTRACP